MPSCEKCGADNPLGRVFCGACGSKLDLRHMTSDEVTRKYRPNWFVLHWRHIVGTLVAVIVIMIGLGMWPQGQSLGTKGTLHGGGRVEDGLGALARLKKGQSLGIEFKEGDINGYFHFKKAEKMQIASLSVAVSSGVCTVRVIKPFGRWDVRKVSFVPRVSYDIVCVPVQGGLKVAKVTVGHLPAFGPVRASVLRKVHGMLARQKEWSVLKQFDRVEMQPGVIAVRARK